MSDTQPKRENQAGRCCPPMVTGSDMFDALDRSPLECAPPAADVLELAENAVDEIFAPRNGDAATLAARPCADRIVARALTEYGDRRAREARAAAIEAAAQRIVVSRLGETMAQLADAVRATIDAAPQSEGGRG
jgi:hypothetical protein